MFVALTMLGVLLTPPSEAPKEIVIHSTHMNVLEVDVIDNFLTYEGIQTVRLTPADKEIHIQSFQKVLQEYQERLKREEEARLKAEQEERERLERERQEQESWLDGVFTAYYPANNAMEGGTITATGYDIGESIYYQGYRVIAADPSIPLYSLVDIKIGDTVIHCQVLDRGGRIRGNLFDVTFPDRTSTYNFGRKYGKYRVVRYGRG